MMRITVTVHYGKKEVAKLTSYRSDIYDTAGVGY